MTRQPPVWPFRVLAILRPGNLALLGIIEYVVYLCLIVRGYGSAIPALMPLADFTILVAMTLCAAGSGYIMNDFYDTAADKINKPGKNVIGVYISEPVVWILLTLIALLGVWFAFVVTIATGKNVLLLYGAGLFTLWLYSAFLQNLPLAGNIAISIVCGAAVYLPWYVQSPVVHVAQWHRAGIIQFFALFAFLITLVREVVKDLEDSEGDMHAGGRTFPLVFGELAARRTILLLIGSILIIFVYWILVPGARFSGLSQVYFALLVCVPLLYIYWKTYKAGTRREYHSVSQYLKLLMLTGTLYLLLI